MLQLELQFGLGLRLLLRLLALLWSLYSRRVCIMGGLHSPTVRPLSYFSFSLSPLLTFCYPFHSLSDHVRDARPLMLVIHMAGGSLLRSLLHPRHHCEPQCLLTDCPGVHEVCEISNCSVQPRQILRLLAYYTLHAAPPVPGGSRGLAPPSPCSFLVSLYRLNYGCARSLRSDGCRRRHHLHHHIHRRVSPPISSFSRLQFTPATHSEFGHHFCEARLLVLVVACSLTDASRQSRFRPSLYRNPLRTVDSCARLPSAVSLVL